MSDLKDPRVLFAAERTMLAWNRTSLGLIAFGFVVERAGLLLQIIAHEKSGSADARLAFWLGLTFIVLGAFTSAFSARQYLVVLRTLNPAEYPRGYGAKWGVVVNVIVALLGACLAVTLFCLHY